jgi:hypothetical protein
MPTKRMTYDRGFSVKVRFDEEPTGVWRIRSLSDPKGPRGPFPLDFLPFNLMNAVHNKTEFDSEYALQRYVEGGV